MIVKKETGIRCFKLGFTLNLSVQIFFIKNGGIRMIIRKLSIATGNVPKTMSSGIMSSRIISVARIVPLAAPASISGTRSTTFWNLV